MDPGKMSEKAVEARLVKEVGKRGALIWKMTGQFVSGLPDRIVIGKDGRIWFVEVKRPKGGVLSPRQKFVRRQLESLGHSWSLVATGIDLQKFLKLMDDEV